MIYRISTLVDITKTNARRGEDKLAYGQQQNYMSMIQTLGLRTNVEVSDPVFKKQKATGFGSDYSNKNLNVWRCIVTVEQGGKEATSIFHCENVLKKQNKLRSDNFFFCLNSM